MSATQHKTNLKISVTLQGFTYKGICLAGFDKQNEFHVINLSDVNSLQDLGNHNFPCCIIVKQWHTDHTLGNSIWGAIETKETCLKSIEFTEQIIANPSVIKNKGPSVLESITHNSLINRYNFFVRMLSHSVINTYRGNNLSLLKLQSNTGCKIYCKSWSNIGTKLRGIQMDTMILLLNVCVKRDLNDSLHIVFDKQSFIFPIFFKPQFTSLRDLYMLTKMNPLINNINCM